MATTAPEALRRGVAFAQVLAHHGERTALHEGDRTLTYRALADRVAAETEALGPDRRLVALEPAATIDFVVAYLAALCGGHPVLLTDHRAVAAAYGVEMVRDGGHWHTTGAAAPPLHPDLQLLLSTSGSTGSPKLVRLSAENLDANATAIAEYLALGCDDVALLTLPLDYCYGLSVLHSHLSAGAAVVLSDRSVTDAALWQRAREAGVTSFAGVPHTFDLLATAGWPDLPTLRHVTQAGGRMPPARVREVAERGRRQGWDLYVMYGQTEATARMTYLPPSLVHRHPESVGRAIPGGSVHIDAPDEHGVGELVYTGPNVMLGYAETPTDLGRGRDVTGLRTGDLARINDAGLVEITGRRTRVAKLFGQRLDLDRVTALLTTEGYDVACAEAADGSGELVVAAAGADAITVDLARAATAARTGLPHHAVRVVAVAEIPRRPNGKPDHAAVARLTDPVGALTSSEPVDPSVAVAREYAAVLGRAVGPADTFAGLGGDSLSYVELAVRLEARLGTLPRDWPTRTVADLARCGRRVQHGRRGWQWLDTTVVLRAVAILLIVGTHTNLIDVSGGAHVLLAVAGFNAARFLLTGPVERRRRSLLRGAARIAVPAMVWVGALAVVTDAYGWRNALLLNDLLGPRRWAEPEYYFWFVEVLVLVTLTAAALLHVPFLADWERRRPFGFAVGLLVAGGTPLAWLAVATPAGDVIHSSPFVAWLFALGWAAARARHHGHRMVVSAALGIGAAAMAGSFDDVQRVAIIVGGILALIWLPALPWPRLLGGATGVVASASLYVYLTHWQVYPHLEYRWPLGGLLASLAVGITVWYAVERAPVARRSRRAAAA